MTLRRDWSHAIAKRDSEGRCRNCGSTHRVELAHIAGRVFDVRAPLRWAYEWKQPVIVHPDRVFPLCGPATDPRTCHGAFDALRLDVLHLLTVEEQAQAVTDLGGIELARKRLCPSDYRPVIVDARQRAILEAAA